MIASQGMFPSLSKLIFFIHLPGSLNSIPGSGSNTDKTDDDLELFLPPEVHGFNLTTKQWLSFELKRLEPMVFDDKAWDHLVLDSDTKVSFRSF